MAVRNALRTGLGLTAAGTARQVVLRGGGGGGGVPPPFARTLAPAGPLHEEHELIWDDGVAAETCLDFDAPHMSSAEGLGWFLGGFLFFYSVFSFASVTGPESQKLAAPRTLPFSGLHVELGGDPDKTPAADDEEEEEEEEEEDDE